MGQILGLFESLRIHHDLRDEFSVGLDHCQLSKELLEILWQVRPASIARIHGHKDANVPTDRDLSSH